MTSINSKEEFCRSFEWNIDIKWFDLVGYTPIDESRRAKIELSDRGYHGHFDKFIVSILDKNEGVVDTKVFRFNDYLDNNKREDNRKDYPIRGNDTFHAWRDRGDWYKMEWYIAIPQTTRPLCEEIEKYIKIFA